MISNKYVGIFFAATGAAAAFIFFRFIEFAH